MSGLVLSCVAALAQGCADDGAAGPCGEVDGGGPGGADAAGDAGAADASLALEELHRAFVVATCERSIRCGNQIDLAACEASIFTSYAQEAADVARGAIKYDGHAAAACLAALGPGTAQGSCLYSERFGTFTPQACFDMFVGTLPVGAPCFSYRECASQRCDGLTGAACAAGTCMPTTFVAPGGDCGATDAMCLGDNICVTSSTSSTCSNERAPAGAPCAGGALCAIGSICVGQFDGSSICVAGSDTGAGCGGGFCDLVADFCGAGDVCMKGYAPGAACAGPFDCLAYAYCDLATSTCVARPKLGEACTDDNCLGALECKSGTCAAPTPDPACAPM
jgi:hypothetical protein